MNVANCLLQAPQFHSATSSISCVLIDDDPKLRQGIRAMLMLHRLESSNTFEIVGEAATIPQAFQVIQQKHPRLILLDLDLSIQSGIELLTRIKTSYESEKRPGQLPGKVLVLSEHREDEWIFRAMQSGADGYLFKGHLLSHLLEAIDAALKNQIYLTPDVAAGFFRSFHFYRGRSQAVVQTLNLTQREQDVLHWLVQGASNEEIAANLYITVATVKAHLTAIFQKLSVTSRTQAIIKALKLGLSG